MVYVRDVLFLFVTSLIAGLINSKYAFSVNFSIKSFLIAIVVILSWIIYTLIEARNKRIEMLWSSLIHWGIGFILWMIFLLSRIEMIADYLVLIYRLPLEGIDKLIIGFSGITLDVISVFLVPLLIIGITYIVSHYIWRETESDQ